MRFTLEGGSAQHTIRGYADGAVTIGAGRHTRSLIVTPTHLVEGWPVTRIEEVTLESLQTALTLKPEILLLGTGAQQRFPDLETTARVAETGIGLEVMNTAAACRTFNVLAFEGRNVVAALII